MAAIQFDDGSDICMSGGAAGADLQWGTTARKAGHRVIHFSFVGHETDAPENEVVRLTDEELCEADPYLLRANESLKRHLLFTEPQVINLLRRDFYQVRWSHSLYGIVNFDHTGIEGGTAWAVQMFLDLGRVQLFVFDQARESWLTFAQKNWVAVEPPLPKGIWAGVGTRNLLPCGRDAIYRLMKYQQPCPSY
jgi:hypothetical protein